MSAFRERRNSAPGMSAFGGKADVNHCAGECPLLATSGRSCVHSTRRFSRRACPSPYQPDKGRSAIYRTDLGPDSCGYALCAAIVGSQGKPSGESPINRPFADDPLSACSRARSRHARAPSGGGGCRPARKRENCLPPAAAVKNPGKPRKTCSWGVGKIHNYLSIYPIRGMRRPYTLVDNAARKFTRRHIRSPDVRRIRGEVTPTGNNRGR